MSVSSALSRALNRARGHDVLLLFCGHLAEVDPHLGDAEQAGHAQLDVLH
jgi:hypothetical protein